MFKSCINKTFKQPILQLYAFTLLKRYFKFIIKNKTMTEEVEIKKPSRKDEFNEWLKGRVGEGYNPEDEDSNYGNVMDYIKSNDEGQTRLMEALQADPRMAQVISDVFNKKKGAVPAFVRYFGKDMLSAEEGSEEAKALEEAESERQKELEEYQASKAEYDKNLEASIPVLEKFGEENKLDYNDFLDQIYDKILAPIFSANYTPELLDMLNKALHYDEDVDNAYKSGQVATKNEKIEKMQKQDGDGLPKIAPSGTAVESKKKQPNSLLAKARLA